MVQSVESRIHKLLLEHNDTLKVADLLLRERDNGKLTWAEQNSVSHFLLACGYTRAFFDQVSKGLKSGQRITWSAFAEALSICKIASTKDDFDQMFIGAAEEHSLKDLVKCRKFDHLDPRFKKIRNSVDHTIMRAEKSSEIPPQAPDVPSHKVVTEEAVPQRPRLQPNFNPEITSSIISRFDNRRSEEKSLRTEAKRIFEEALDISPGGEIEAAVALGMMGAWSEGLEILQRMEASFQRHLLELDFLLQADRDVEVLHLAEKLLSQSPNLQQKSYIQYMQCRALVNLKRPNEAYELLENLIAEDPDHIGARALLNQIRETHR